MIDFRFFVQNKYWLLNLVIMNSVHFATSKIRKKYLQLTSILFFKKFDVSKQDTNILILMK